MEADVTTAEVIRCDDNSDHASAIQSPEEWFDPSNPMRGSDETPNQPLSFRRDRQGGLIIDGGSGSNYVRVVGDGDRLIVTYSVNGEPLQTQEFTGVGSISFFGFSRNAWDDYFQNDTNLPSLAIGNDGDDVLIGGDGNDFLVGGPGNDFVVGRGGDDNLDGNEGDDVLQGGDGDDDLSGDRGNDRLFGDTGNDDLRGSDGSDVLDGGVGNDKLTDFGLPPHDVDLLVGGEGDDILETRYWHWSGVQMDGGPGDDEIIIRQVPPWINDGDLHFGDEFDKEDMD